MTLLNNALIAGGAGFLGSHLAARLLGAGHRVICVDNFLSGSYENIAQFRDHRNFELVAHDVCVPLQVDADQIYNFAGLMSPIFERQLQKEMAETSVLGALNLLKLAKEMKCRIFQASSNEVYDLPIPAPPTGEDWAKNYQIRFLPSYAASKRYAETLFHKYAEADRIDIKIARIFDSYGPRMAAGNGNIVAEFIGLALRGKDLIIADDGERLHSLCYVDDVIDACVRFMDRPAAITGPVDIGALETVSTLTLAKTIISLTGSSSKIVIERKMRGAKTQLPRAEQAWQMLGWAAGTRLETGLMRTIEYFDQQLSLTAIGSQG